MRGCREQYVIRGKDPTWVETDEIRHTTSVIIAGFQKPSAKIRSLSGPLAAALHALAGMATAFTDLGLNPALLAAVEEAGYEAPAAIQARTTPADARPCRAIQGCNRRSRHSRMSPCGGGRNW